MTLNPTLPVPDWDADPRLIVGWRQRSTLAGARIPLDENVLEELREVARETLRTLETTESRSYEPDAELEVGEEHFAISRDDLPSPTPTGASAPAASTISTESLATAAILALTDNPDGLDELHPSQLSQQSYLFYGLVFDTAGGHTATFIKKVDPVKAAGNHRISLLGRNVLKKVEPPKLVLSGDVDLLITHQNVLITRKRAFELLFNDVQVALQDAPANIARTKASLSGKVVLGSAAESSLAAVAAKRPTYAVRLRRLPDRIDASSISPQGVRDQLTNMGNAHTDLLDGDIFDFGVDRVGLFLDLMEGRHFDDKWTGTHMRADRMSHYKPHA